MVMLLRRPGLETPITDTQPSESMAKKLRWSQAVSHIADYWLNSKQR